MSGTPVKILTVGSAAGSIREMFSKVKAIDAKHGKFDLVLCTGDFFGPPKVDEEYGENDEVMQLLDGSLEAPVECYIMQGQHPLPPPVIEKFAKTGGALNKNVFLLHKSGVMSTAHGLRIACLGGTYEANMYSAAQTLHGFVSPYFTSQTVEKLISNTMTQSIPSSKSKDTSYNSLASIKANTSTSHLIDVLLTNTFPQGITALSNAPLPSPDFTSQLEAEPVAELVSRIKPRYHFAVGVSSGKQGQSPLFWEREPFVWENENGRFTRFISLGAFGGEAAPSTGKKQRWFYAFSITPAAPNESAPPRPVNATGNPLSGGVHRGLKRPMEEDEGENYRWGNVKQGPKKAKAGGSQGKPPDGYKCKICESGDHFITDCPDRAKPKEGYICKICNEPGHFVRDCPTKHQVGDTGGRKPREGYVCRACGSELHFIQDCPTAQSHGPRGGKPPREIAPDECWFCLSNPKLAKHLIVSIGSECYVTLPKGQIIPTHTKSSFPSGKIPTVPGGGHVLIVPITHYPTYASIPPDLSGPIIQETKSYKSALFSFYAKHAAHPVSFEVGRLSAKGGHAHVQVVPVPQTITADTIANAFTSEGTRLGVEFEIEETEREGVTGDRGYFRVELPDGRKLVHWLRDGVPFSIQFGRQVLVGLLGIPERFDWKECSQSDDEDREDAEAFTAAFSPFDPTL
ncbi:nuclear protein [Cristinia sonorae]|uniref:Nuclear protein n=1 Tax=Cristinia sonorae TaxID=1940300 RepID=A0A8K0UL72_9AGAR|nr:nuclear protein [Cristinia sonorae]